MYNYIPETLSSRPEVWSSSCSWSSRFDMQREKCLWTLQKIPRTKDCPSRFQLLTVSTVHHEALQRLPAWAFPPLPWIQSIHVPWMTSFRPLLHCRNTSFWQDQRHDSTVTQMVFLSAAARDWIFSPTAVHLQHSCLCPVWDPWILLFLWISHSALSACTGFVSLQDLLEVEASSSFSLSKLCIVHWFFQILLHRVEMYYIFAQPLSTGGLVYAGCHRQCLSTYQFLLGSDFKLHMTPCVKPLPAVAWFFTLSPLPRHCPPPFMIYFCFLTSFHSVTH